MIKKAGLTHPTGLTHKPSSLNANDLPKALEASTICTGLEDSDDDDANDKVIKATLNEVAQFLAQCGSAPKLGTFADIMSFSPDKTK